MENRIVFRTPCSMSIDGLDLLADYGFNQTGRELFETIVMQTIKYPSKLIAVKPTDIDLVCTNSFQYRVADLFEAHLAASIQELLDSEEIILPSSDDRTLFDRFYDRFYVRGPRTAVRRFGHREVCEFNRYRAKWTAVYQTIDRDRLKRQVDDLEQQIDRRERDWQERFAQLERKLARFEAETEVIKM